MRTTFAVAAAISMFALGAYSGLGAQTEENRGEKYDAALYLPRVPQPGDRIEIEDPSGWCTVETVVREWVKCAERAGTGLPSPSARQRSVWHNVYNGHTHKVSSPPR